MEGVGRDGAIRRARAFAPGHLTALFVPELGARDPRARGSVGAGLVLDRGVVAEARWDPSGPRRCAVRSRPTIPLPISREVARRLFAPSKGRLEVDLRHDLPVGQGLGMSAAGAVATGLAVARVLGLPEGRAWTTAHLVELYRGGGLGGVAAIHGGGGLEVRSRPGVPPFGTVVHRPASVPLALFRCGPSMPTSSVLRDRRALREIVRAGRGELRRLGPRPSAGSLLRAAERFTDAVGLASPAVRRSLDALRSDGWIAAQAMFGSLVFAAPAEPGALRRPTPKGLGRRLAPVAVGRRGARTLGPVDRQAF